MSDRPCNLWEHRRRLRKYGDRLTQSASEGNRDVRWFIDGKFAGEYMSLPDEAHCGAYGGSCEC